MARKIDVAATVVNEQTLIQGVAKYFLEKVYGPEGMPWGTRSADLEELSVQIGQAMSRIHGRSSPGTTAPVSAVGGGDLLGV